jgi:hypothetical protein
MTDRTAADLLISLEVMRLVRSEDHRACVRLAARVKELEEEVASLAHARDYWMARAGELSGAVLGIRKPSDGERMEAMTTLLEADRAKLAEGTREEKVNRCDVCAVPVSNIAARRCDACDRKHGTGP